MRCNWLTRVERQYVRTLLDEAIEHVKLRDMKACAAFVQHAIKARRMSSKRNSNPTCHHGIRQRLVEIGCTNAESACSV
jgi:hypothetical protein